MSVSRAASLDFSSVTVPLLIQGGPEVAFVCRLRRALIEKVTELWRAFFPLAMPLSLGMASDCMMPLRFARKLRQLLLFQYQLSSGKSTAYTLCR